MSTTLLEDTIADVIKLFLDEGLAVAGAKPQQMVMATDTGRMLVINAAGNGIEIGISDDSKQMLLAGDQVLSGEITFLNTLHLGSNGPTEGAKLEINGLHLDITNKADGDIHIFSERDIDLVTNTEDISLTANGSSVKVNAAINFPVNIAGTNRLVVDANGATVDGEITVKSLRLSTTLTGAVGGANEGAAPDLNSDSFGAVDLAPAAGQEFFNIVLKPEGKLLVLRNGSATITAEIGTDAQFKGGTVSMPPRTAMMIYCDGTFWWDLSEFTQAALGNPILADGSVPFLGDQSMGGKNLTNVNNITNVNAQAMKIETIGFADLDLESGGFFSLEAANQLSIRAGGTQNIDASVNVLTLGVTKSTANDPRIVAFSCPVRHSNMIANQQAGPGNTQGTQPVDAAVVIVGFMLTPLQAITLPDADDFCQNIRGAIMWIKNNTSADTLLVFPDVGARINQLATNASFSIPPGVAFQFMSMGLDGWVTL